jgi:AhpD family alkylhydroperoxidase
VSAIEEVAWGECLVEPSPDRELERIGRKHWGVPNHAIRYFTSCPWLARALAEGNLRNERLAHLDLDLYELIFLAVSQDNSCRYCYSGQRAQFRILGFDEQKIRAIEQASYAAQFEPRERLLLDYARRLSRSNPAPASADLRELVDAGYATDAVREATYAAANTVIANRLTTLPGLPLARVEGIEDRLSTRLLRPLVARVIRSACRPGRPKPLPENFSDAPFEYVIRTLEGLPVGPAFMRTLVSAWESPILPQRTKALAFAVVARGLGSERMEAEAIRLADTAGFDPKDTTDVLAHLGSPKLDPIEAAVVPVARETIRYRPEDIQRRAREVRAQLSQEEFLEFVGVVALANGIGRLSLVLCEDR